MTSSKKTFNKMDWFIIHHVNLFLKRLYPRKSHKWIKGKHFKPSKDKRIKDKYLLTNPETGNQIKRMAWVPIKYAWCINIKQHSIKRNTMSTLKDLNLKTITNVYMEDKIK